MIPQLDKTKTMNFQYKNGSKGQIYDGTISKKCHKEYNLYGKFHNCIKCTIFGHSSSLFLANHRLRIKSAILLLAQTIIKL